MPAACDVRPRVARTVAWSLLALIWSGTAVLLWLSSGYLTQFTWEDRVLTLVFVAAGSFLIYRQATVRLSCDDDGATVRNLIYTRHVSWAQIVRVNFALTRPWAVLDLADGDALAVMAIQSADGARAVAAAQQLADLVAAHEPTEPGAGSARSTGSPE